MGAQRRGFARALGTLAGVLLLAGVGVGAGWWFLALEVTTTRLAVAPVLSAFYSTGTVAPKREFPIRAQVTGNVRQLPVDKGSQVRKGQVLAVVEDPRLELAVAAAEAQLREAAALADPETSPAVAEFDTQLVANAALLAIAEREHERLVRMREASAATSADLDRAMDRIKTLTAERGALTARRDTTLLAMRRQFEVAEAQLASARAQADRQVVRSPADGVVLDRPTPLGTHVDATMSNHLMTVADVRQESLIVRAQVDEQDIAAVRIGQEVRMTLYAFGTTVFNGVVERISDQADPERRTFETDVRVEAGDRRLSAGMTGELAFVLERREAAQTLPVTALQLRIRPRRPGEARPPTVVASAADADREERDEVREQVIWVVRDGRLQPATARVGLRSLERIEVLDGLGPADEVVTSAVPPRTAEGTRVRVRR